LISNWEKVSPFAGEMWANNRNFMEAWSIISKEQYSGNFTSETRNPILFVGNSHDPATPNLYARKMATLFPNASYLNVDIYGHCSIAQVNKCAESAIAAYFVNGTIPSRGKTQEDGFISPGQECKAERGPFDPLPESNETASTFTLSSAGKVRFDLPSL
jgi:hypothetical protein